MYMPQHRDICSIAWITGTARLLAVIPGDDADAALAASVAEDRTQGGDDTDITALGGVMWLSDAWITEEEGEMVTRYVDLDGGGSYVDAPSAEDVTDAPAFSQPRLTFPVSTG